MSIPCITKYRGLLFLLQNVLPSLASMPGPDTTFRAMAPCCVYAKPQITGFFIQSPSIGEYCAATSNSAEAAQATLGKCMGTISGKERSPRKDFIFSSYQAPISLGKLCLLLENALGRTFTLLIRTMPGLSINKPTSIPCLQKKETCTNSHHKLRSQPHYKSHI